MNFLTLLTTAAALKFCFKTCVAMKFVDDDDDEQYPVKCTATCTEKWISK